MSFRRVTENDDQEGWTPFAKRASKFLHEVKSIGVTESNPIEVLGVGTEHEANDWRHTYPKCVVAHFLIRTNGLATGVERDVECSSSLCTSRKIAHHAIHRLPDSFPAESTGRVYVLQEHHVDLILSNDWQYEEARRFDHRVFIHGTTPVFHPNIGDPKNQYCLGYPLPTSEVSWFMDQCLGIISWQKYNERDIRNRDALNYLAELQKHGIARIDRVRRDCLFESGAWRR